MMGQRVFFTTLLSAVLFLIEFSGSALADLATEQYVENFNNMNGMDSYGAPQGYLFTREISSAFYGLKSGEIRLVNNLDADPSMGQTPDLLAYSSLTANKKGTETSIYFQTFVVAPEQTKMSEGEFLNGQLHFRTAPNQTNTIKGNPLTLGVAYLYKEFAAGTLGKGTAFEYKYEEGRVASAVML